MDWKRLFLSVDGRIGRREFWIGFAIIIAASLVLGMLPPAGEFLAFLLVWPQIALHAKRLHDMGRSAWLQLIPFGVTIVCVVLAAATGGAAVFAEDASPESMGAAAGFLGFAGLFGLAFLLWVGLSKGEAETNRFGPPVTQ